MHFITTIVFVVATAAAAADFVLLYVAVVSMPPLSVAII